MINNTFKEIAEKLIKAKTVLLYPHVGIDGDAVGCCVAVSKALRKIGNKCYALYAEDLPENLKYMYLEGDLDDFRSAQSDDKACLKSYFSDDMNVISDEELDISMCVDCGAYDRFVDFKEKFDRAKLTICVDHHGTSEGIADLNYIDPDASACGELIFELIKEMDKLCPGILPDREIGEALFGAITTDTGNFQYSNTTAKTHKIIAELYDWDIDANGASVEIYENERPSAVMIANRALGRLEMIAGGLGAVCYVTKEDISELDVKAGETDPIVQKIRSIRGVEYAAFIKEKEENVIRVSYRAKRKGDVSVLAKLHEGGGHIKAAGCTLYMPLEEAVKIIKADIEEACRNLI